MINLFGETIPAPAVPARQLNLFDETDYIRPHRGIPAVVCRENGEKASGTIYGIESGWFPSEKKGWILFAEQETGKKYSIPGKCCSVNLAGDIVVIKIDEMELSWRVSLYGMFESCCLF